MLGAEESIQVAERLRFRHLIAMTDNGMEGVSRLKQRESAIEVLKRCVPSLERANVFLVIEAYFQEIGYFHVADHPGRHEPGTGEITYLFLMNKLRELG